MYLNINKQLKLLSMKRLLQLLSFASAILFLSSCSRDDSLAHRLEGTWDVESIEDFSEALSYYFDTPQTITLSKGDMYASFTDNVATFYNFEIYYSPDKTETYKYFVRDGVIYIRDDGEEDPAFLISKITPKNLVLHGLYDWDDLPNDYVIFNLRKR